jgi:hypothetical protein
VPQIAMVTHGYTAAVRLNGVAGTARELQDSIAVRQLADPLTLCDSHGVFFVAASGQTPIATDRCPKALRYGRASKRLPGA